MTPRNGGDLLVDVLRRFDVDTVFGLVSVHNLPLVDAVDRELRFVPVRHEATAVNAADGYARARAGLGCALTSTGTGAGNAAGSLVESLSSGTSVLHVTGQIDTPYLGSGRGFIHETKDQPGMLAAVSKAAATIDSATTAGEILQHAARTALTAPGGPVSIEWPIDLQYAEPGPLPPPPHTRESEAPDPSTITEIANLLTRAKRPAIWAGGGAARAGDQLRRLTETLGAALFTSNSGRGAVPEDHELCIGNYATAPAGRALLAEADLLLSIGTHFRSNETATYTLPVPAQHVQVDLDPAAIGRVYPVTLGLTADATAFLDALLTRLDTESHPSWTKRVRETRAAVRENHRTALGDHTLFPDALRKTLPRNAVIARDVTIASSSWGNRLLEIHDPRTNIFPRGGGIGQGLGMAIGAALARPDLPTVGIVGDGGLAVHFGELMTLVQEAPWLVLLVFNDRGYGVLRNMQDAMRRPHAGVDLTTPDYNTVCAGLGLPHLRVADPGSVAPALEQAVGHRGPVLVEIDLTSYPPMPNPFTPPVHVPGDPS
ncbi:acetolactate synthase-1/2/3 large subunit [Actinomadura pelletieri DSM 43383]|uniref:Acetolactate synthase-1/2/3 large subunit n=1 Tax=Actinomadura pelletieri DSM 43383 TaxID=1120940 RepID=A0A495QSL4_9ACTN|nr:thiamine pyrophosphate-binding protein [Actinomadura pelletieri]RKS76506.1 acetolactate synthase-1/2/3 large subunit [Actinomadura pelletieri DSM 43383]